MDELSWREVYERSRDAGVSERRCVWVSSVATRAEEQAVAQRCVSSLRWASVSEPESNCCTADHRMQLLNHMQGALALCEVVRLPPTDTSHVTRNGPAEPARVAFSGMGEGGLFFHVTLRLAVAYVLPH